MLMTMLNFKHWVYEYALQVREDRELVPSLRVHVQKQTHSEPIILKAKFDVMFGFSSSYLQTSTPCQPAD